MLGQTSPTGFLLYYPFVFLVKTPLPTLMLAAIGIGRLIARRDRRSIVVWLPPALFMVAAIVSNLSLGYRLILPVLPFVLMIAGSGFDAAVDGITRPRRRTATVWAGFALVAVLAVWHIYGALAIAPYHIAYFNPLIFDRDRDYDVLVDSNLDWGQDLISLREWVKAQNLDAIDLAYETFAVALLYGEVDGEGFPRFDAIVGGPVSYFDETTGELVVRMLLGWGGEGVFLSDHGYHLGEHGLFRRATVSKRRQITRDARPNVRPHRHRDGPRKGNRVHRSHGDEQPHHGGAAVDEGGEKRRQDNSPEGAFA